MTSVIDLVHGEIWNAREELRVIEWIRVTADALPGLVACVPITPERARNIKLMQYPNGVDVDIELVARPHWEIMVHPKDWRTVLIDVRARTVLADDLTELMGLPVVR